jgi:large subunit ribosomal protein L13
MCAKIAFIIQGKTSPHYRANKVEYKDQCIVINSKYTYLTGKKFEQKLYRHHTGYPGGLVEIKAKTYMEKNPIEMITRSVKGMLPKNKMRPEFLSKLKVYPENAEELESLKLPQFGIIKPVDYNKIFGIDHDKEFTPENYKLIDVRGDINLGNKVLN